MHPVKSMELWIQRSDHTPVIQYIPNEHVFLYEALKIGIHRYSQREKKEKNDVEI